MKKLLLTLLFAIFLSNVIFAEESRKIIVNKYFKLGRFYVSTITITPDSFFVEIYCQFDKTLVFDDITGPDLTPVKIIGYRLGNRLKPNTRFTIEMPRSMKTLYFYGINKFGNNDYINLTPYEKYVKARTNRKGLEDSEKPRISIDYPNLKKNFYRTDELFVTVEGKVTDNLGVLGIKINGETAAISNTGLFKKRLKLKIGKNSVLVKATDINNNIATTDFVLIRDEIIQDTQFSDVDFPKATLNINKNTIAVVFGIENYRNAPSVSFAVNDADIFREYLIKRFGLQRENIYLRLDEQATKGEFDKVFSLNGWINRHSSNNTNVIVYFAGHGAPDVKSKEAFLIPFDGDPNYATSTGYPIQNIYNNLGKLDVNSVTIIIDACFSGISRDDQLLLADSRPIHLSVKGSTVSENTIVFSAASGSEISSSYKQKKHGIFTYYFLKGLNGDADENHDKEITMLEMQNYLSDNVLTQAKKMGREQTPQLHGKDTNRVLLKY